MSDLVNVSFLYTAGINLLFCGNCHTCWWVFNLEQAPLEISLTFFSKTEAKHISRPHKQTLIVRVHQDMCVRMC